MSRLINFWTHALSFPVIFNAFYSLRHYLLIPNDKMIFFIVEDLILSPMLMFKSRFFIL